MNDNYKDICKGQLSAERKFFYYFSIKLIKLIKNTAIKPDHLTLISFSLIIVFSIILTTVKSINFFESVILVILLLLSNIFDAADGQLSRLRKEFSSFGWLMDALFDLVKQYLIILSITIYFVRTSKPLIFIIISISAIFLIQFKYLYRHIINSNIDKIVNAVNPLFKGIHFKFIEIVDKYINKFKLGLLTVGEFYIIISLGIITRLEFLSLSILVIYVLFIIVYEFIRTIMSSQLLKYYTKDNKSVIIFGAGEAGVKLYKLLIKTGINPVYFSDNSQGKHYKECYGLQIIPPESIKEKALPVIIASEWYREISLQLKGYGIEDYFPFVI